jgi:hypothetical protein
VTWRARGLQRAVNIEQAPKMVVRRPTLAEIQRWAGRSAQPVAREALAGILGELCLHHGGQSVESFAHFSGAGG